MQLFVSCTLDVSNLQVEFNSTARVNGVIIRGDLYEDYVTAFRVLFSQDGHHWYPYTDGQEADKV